MLTSRYIFDPPIISFTAHVPSIGVATYVHYTGNYPDEFQLVHFTKINEFCTQSSYKLDSLSI